MRNAFVSHSTSDDGYVAELESFLRAAGFDEVFNDVSAIKPDEKFWAEIQKCIANCDAFFAVITSASGDSEWVKREVEHARGLAKTIIPVWIENCPVPTTFEGRDVIDFRPRKRELWREVFIEPIIRKLGSFRFWLTIATVAALVSAPIALWKFYVAGQLQGKIEKLGPQVESLENEKDKLSDNNKKAEEKLKIKQGEVDAAITGANDAKRLQEQSQKNLETVNSQLIDTKGKLTETSKELSSIQSRLICVMDSVTRREMIGRICGELSSLPNVIDQEPISVGRKTSDFRKQITESALALAPQIKSIDQRHPALIIVHLHALRPEKQAATSDPNANLEASALLATLTHLRGTKEFPAPDILIYSRSEVTTERIVALAENPVKDEVASLKSRIHAIKAPMVASTSDTTALGLKVAKILEERAKRLGEPQSAVP